MTESFRLPDGTGTSDSDEYIASWRELGGAIVEVLGEGAQVYAFDPDIQIDTADGNELTLDVATAQAIARLHAKVELLDGEVVTQKKRAEIAEEERDRLRAVLWDIAQEMRASAMVLPGELDSALLRHDIDPATLQEE